MPTKAPPKPPRVQCQHCTYSAEPGASLAGHLSMKHPEIPRGNTPRLDAMIAEGVERMADAMIASSGACVESNHVPGCRHFPAAPAVPSPSAAGAAASELAIAEILVEDNVREDLGDLEDLVESIREHGLLQAVLVDRHDGGWRLVDGHRRLEACRRAPLERIPVQLASRTFEGAERTTVQIVANSHRRDLDPIEEARGYARIIEAEGITQAEVARRLSKSPATISNALRLLTLDPTVLERIQRGEISASHGKAIASLPPKQQQEVASSIVARSMSSKDLERTLEWKRSEADQEKARADKSERAAPKALAALEKAGVPKDALVVVGANTYDYDVPAIAAAIRRGGWKKCQGSGYHPDRPEGCDCASVEVVIRGTAKVKPVCSDRAHQDAHRSDESRAWQLKRDEEERRRAELRSLLESHFAACSLEWPVMRLLERALRQWGEDPDGKEAIVESIAASLSSSYRIREVLTDELLVDLGAEAAS